MAKAGKSRKSASKIASKAKPRKAAKASSKSAKPAVKASAKATPKKTPAASGGKKSLAPTPKKSRPVAAEHVIKTSAATAVLPRPERPATRSVPAPVEQQPAEGETPPALPVPIASFTF
jgi:hypothetical protein